MDGGGGHEDKLPGHIEVHILHHLYVLDVLLGYGGYGYVVDLHLVSFYEVEEKVEGPFEDIEFYAVGHIMSLFAFIAQKGLYFASYFFPAPPPRPPPPPPPFFFQ